jgi:hypothetical protein
MERLDFVEVSARERQALNNSPEMQANAKGEARYAAVEALSHA